MRGGCKTPVYKLGYGSSFLEVIGTPEWSTGIAVPGGQCSLEALGLWRCPSVYITESVYLIILANPLQEGEGALLLMRDQNFSVTNTYIIAKLQYVRMPLVTNGGNVAQ